MNYAKLFDKVYGHCEEFTLIHPEDYHYFEGGKRSLEMLRKAGVLEIVGDGDGVYDLSQDAFDFPQMAKAAWLAGRGKSSSKGVDSKREFNKPCECIHCGEIFYANRFNAKYCSDKCRVGFHRERVRRVKLLQDANALVQEFRASRSNIGYLSTAERLEVEKLEGAARYMLEMYQYQLDLLAPIK